MEALIHDQRFLNAFFVHFRQHNVAGFAFADGHQTRFRRHVNTDRLIQIGHEAHVAPGDDTNQFVLFSHNRVACEAVALGQFFHFTQGGGRQDGLRVSHDAGFMFFHAANFFRLALDRHVFVDKADAAFLRQGNRQTRFRDGIHRR